MNDRDKTDVWTALAVGAVVGIGAALLLRSIDEPEPGVLGKLRPVQRQARRVAKEAGKQLGRTTRKLGDRGEDLLEQGSDALGELRRDAARIVAQARKELEQVAEGSLKQARSTVRRARRRFV